MTNSDFGATPEKLTVSFGLPAMILARDVPCPVGSDTGTIE